MGAGGVTTPFIFKANGDVFAPSINVMAGFIPAIHVSIYCRAAKTWMPGSRLVLAPAKAGPEYRG